MSITPLLLLPDWLAITSVSETPTTLLVRVTSTSPSSPRLSSQDFAQKGLGVTCLCEQAVVRGNPKGQTEDRNNLMKSEEGDFLCHILTHLPHDAMAGEWICQFVSVRSASAVNAMMIEAQSSLDVYNKSFRKSKLHIG
jgi:hypothetical protein